MGKKKVAIDVLLNLVSNGVPIIILQIVILPSLANSIGDEKYGLVITIISFLSVVPIAMGNSLNNIRLLRNERYREKHKTGDFNLLLISIVFISVIALQIFIRLYKMNMTTGENILLCGLCALACIYEYFIVTFRIRINYVYILLANLCLVIGYGIGTLVFQISGVWMYIYLLGYICANIFVFWKSDIWKESITKTLLFKSTVVQFALLLGANLLNCFTNYADRLLIYPLLGGRMVGVYYASTIIGKMIIMAITPISGVALSYLTKYKKEEKILFFKCLFLALIIGGIGYFFCLIVTKPVLKILYPQYLNEAMKMVPITTATAMLSAIISIITPFTLRYAKMWWQIVINSTTILFYVIFSLLLLKKWGIVGFCWGVLITTFIKMVISISAFLVNTNIFKHYSDIAK